MGDARVSLEREEGQAFDVLVLDAFSGDSPPTHLLTREAFRVYLRHLKPDGVLAVNVTNSYLDLAPVAQAQADAAGLKSTRVFVPGDFNDNLRYDSYWMLLTRDEGLLASVPPRPRPGAPADRNLALWTDDYSNVFQTLLTQ
jgi:hypothetical protein